MLDLKYVRENLSLVGEKIAERGLDIDLGPLRELEADRRQILRNIEDRRQKRNVASREIAAKKQKQESAEGEIRAMKEVADTIKELEKKLRECEESLKEQLHYLPNLQDASVPKGASEEENVEIRRQGEPPAFDFAPRSHWEVGETLGILDFERASKITGARFALYWDLGARLERALISSTAIGRFCRPLLSMRRVSSARDSFRSSTRTSSVSTAGGSTWCRRRKFR
jgi:seryl-tRNA synthetase